MKKKFKNYDKIIRKVYKLEKSNIFKIEKKGRINL